MARIGSRGTPLQVALAVCGVELADRVGAAREAQRERGHVELVRVAVDATAELEQPLDVDAGVPRRSG